MSSFALILFFAVCARIVDIYIYIYIDNKFVNVFVSK
jgi:hypothetical protein